MEKTHLLIDRVDALSETSPGAEDALMDGYARALELEGERVRLERRFAQVAHELAREGAELLPELRSLKQRISKIDTELAQLRAVLAAARRRLTAAPESAAS